MSGVYKMGRSAMSNVPTEVSIRDRDSCMGVTVCTGDSESGTLVWELQYAQETQSQGL